MPPSPSEARQRPDRASSTTRLRQIAPIPTAPTPGSFPPPSYLLRTVHQEGSVPSGIALRPQLPETPRRPLPAQPNVNVSPLNVRWTPIPNSSQLELHPPAVREEILGSYLVNNIITCETPAEVDVETLLSPHERNVRDQTIRGFERNFDKLKVASKQLGNELTDDERRKKKVREDEEKRRTGRIAYLDRVWPGWIPRRCRGASKSDLTLKIVRSIHHVVTKILTLQTDFDLDSLWSSTGIFRRHLEGSRLTVKAARAAEKEILELLIRGGIPALVDAQAVNPTPSEGNDDITAATPEPKVNNIVEATTEPAGFHEVFDLVHPEPLPDFKPEQGTEPDLYSATPPVPATPARPPTHIVDPDTEFGKDAEFFPVDFDFHLPAVSSLVHETNDHLEPPPPSPSPRPPKPSVAPLPLTSSMMEASGRSSKSQAPRGDLMNYQLLASMAGVKRSHSGSDPGGKKQKTEGKFGFLSKLQTQLATDTRLTDDVLNVVCKAVYAFYRNDGNKGMLLDPLWFHKDKPSEALPIGPKGIKERPRMYFPIHHPDAEHWALGTLESVSDGFRLCYYDSQCSPGRFEGVRDRLRKWLDKSGFEKEELEAKEKACPQQNDSWSCGIYAIFFLSMVLRREAFPAEIDLVAEKSNILNILGSVDLAGSFSEEEKRALRGLRKRGEAQNSLRLEDRLSQCTIDTLHQRLKTAEQRLTEATEKQKLAYEKVSGLKAKQKSRTDVLQQMQELMGKLGVELSQHALQQETVSRRSSGIHQSLTTSVAQGSSSSDLLSMLDETSEQSQTQSIKMNHAGVRVGAEWMAGQMQNSWPSLDSDLAVAEQQHDSAYRAVVDALQEVEGCNKAIGAKGDFDELVRARAAFDECAARCEVWEAEDMDGGISLPDME